jgi:hypothetical protein
VRSGLTEKYSNSVKPMEEGTVGVRLLLYLVSSGLSSTVTKKERKKKNPQTFTFRPEKKIYCYVCKMKTIVDASGPGVGAQRRPGADECDQVSI